MKKLKTKIDRIKEHLVDSTAVATITNPIMGGLETTLAGMSNDTSMNARILGTALTYAGMGSLYSKGRDLSKRTFKITEKTREGIKYLHDTVYGLTYLLVITPAFYYAAGSRDIKEIAAGTAITAGVGAVMGGPAGYVIDMYRDLAGIQESERLPDLIKNQKPSVKKTLFGLITAASVGALALIYNFSH